MAIPFAAGLPANFAAPYNCTIASVILPVAVSLALSSDCFKISPIIDCSSFWLILRQHYPLHLRPLLQMHLLILLLNMHKTKGILIKPLKAALPTDSPKPTSFKDLSSPRSNSSLANKTFGFFFVSALPSVPFLVSSFCFINSFCSSIFFKPSPIPYFS